MKKALLALVVCVVISISTLGGVIDHPNAPTPPPANETTGTTGTPDVSTAEADVLAGVLPILLALL